jgi:aminopeptidase N
MENWGLVTYREAKVLVQPGASSESTRRGIARTICHELAHQWFGNLVTPEFWTQLWLKEGAARFLEFVATDHIFPKWNMWTEFVQNVLGLALQLDAMAEPSSHPVEVEVSDPDEINDIFDAISYAKGASIIRMVSHVIGSDAFFRGMRLYLERHAYGNAVTNDLWGALEETSRFPVVEFMSPWTLKAGFPILELNDDGSVRISRFLASGRESDSYSDMANVWPVPVTALVDGADGVQGPWILNGPGGRDETDVLTSKIKEWTSDGLWFKLNVDQTGFFRVSYTSSQWERLAPALNPTGSALSTSDRLGLISDAFAAGRSGYSPLVDSLRLVSGFGSHVVTGTLFVCEHSLLPWVSAHAHRSAFSVKNTLCGKSYPTISLP